MRSGEVLELIGRASVGKSQVLGNCVCVSTLMLRSRYVIHYWPVCAWREARLF